MTYSLSNNCTKNYYNRTLTVQVILEDVVTWIFLRHSVDVKQILQGRPRMLMRDLFAVANLLRADSGSWVKWVNKSGWVTWVTDDPLIHD